MEKKLMIKTQEEIARKLDISRMTVYRALYNKPDISEITRKKVLELVKEHGYQPNDVARSLVLKKTNTLGLILPCVTHSFFPEITRAIEEAANENGYHVILCHTNRNWKKEAREIDVLRAKKVDGMIITPVAGRKGICAYQQLKEMHLPFVLIDLYIDGFECNFVGTDDVAGAYQATKHLIDLGHILIGHLAGPLAASTARDRLKGYQQALKANGILFNAEYVKMAGFEYEDGERAIGEFLKTKNRPTAIFAVNDPVAMGAYLTLKAMGLSVPDDMALVGFGGMRAGAFLGAPLTTVVQPAQQIGKTAYQMLIEEIERGIKPAKKVQIIPSLLVRESCGAKLKI